MKGWLIIVAFIAFSFQLKSGFSSLEFLKGTWKVEGKEQYEFWNLSSDNELNGYTYNITGGQKLKMETIALKLINNQIVYKATVPNQNEGRTIQFILNSDVKSCFSFENPEHDFPKKIQYEKKSDDEILIRVLGDEGKGFSYYLKRIQG